MLNEIDMLWETSVPLDETFTTGPVGGTGGDEYVALRERMNRARRQEADLFISIHADAFRSPKVSGASVKGPLAGTPLARCIEKAARGANFGKSKKGTDFLHTFRG